MEGRYSTRSPAVKRLMREAQELCEPTDQYFAQPLEDNLFEWHFTVRGPADSDFSVGIYHGRIILPVDYPMKPPSIIWLTPNGRFETNKKICLSISGHHPESWQPSWSIRTALLAIIGFMPTHPGGAIGSLDYKPEERKTLAKKSRDWKCPVCGDVSEILLEPNPESSQTSQEAKELASQISFQGEKQKSPEKKNTDVTVVSSPLQANPVVNADGLSNNASTFPPSTAPLNNPPNPETLPLHPGTYSPWTFPPMTANFNSPMSTQFLPNPFISHPFSNLGQIYGVASQIPRFPYPPSHYNCAPNMFYPGNLPFPPGAGMFLCPFPPQMTTVSEQNVTSLISNFSACANNSSETSPNGSQDAVNNSNSPDTPRVPNIPPPSPSSTAASSVENSVPGSPSCSPLKVHVLNELLNRVKRVGSDDQNQTNEIAEPLQATSNQSTSPNEPVFGWKSSEEEKMRNNAPLGQQPALAFEDFGLNASDIEMKNSSAEDFNCAFEPAEKAVIDEVLQDSDAGPEIGDHCQLEDSTEKTQMTDNDVSVSLVKKESLNESTGLEISHSDFLADGDDVDPIGYEISDTEQRSNFERSASVSMPDLKKKPKQGNLKGVRQRQSATTPLLSHFTTGEQTPTEQDIDVGARLRIEAVSGDSTTANQHRLLLNGAHEVEGAHNHVNDAHAIQRRHRGRAVQSSYDLSFMVMIGLCITTIFLILNRLFYMVDFSEVFY